MAASSALACAVWWSALLAAALAETTGEAQATTASAKAGTDDAETISAEYVVHPDIHPLERIEQWTEQIEKNNGSASAIAPMLPPLSRSRAPTLRETLRWHARLHTWPHSRVHGRSSVQQQLHSNTRRFDQPTRWTS